MTLIDLVDRHVSCNTYTVFEDLLVVMVNSDLRFRPKWLHF